MAKTIKQWYQVIVDEKQSLSSLDEFTPNPETTQEFINDLALQSKVAIWRLSAWVSAFLAFTLETLWDQAEARLQAIRDETEPHSLLWWENQVKAYQHGDTTIIDDNGRVTYSEIDEDKQIVGRVNVTNTVPAYPSTDPAYVTIQVSKGNLDDGYEVMDISERAGFDGYIAEIAPLGIKTNIFHDTGGQMNLGGYIWYDASILNSDMTLIDDSSVNVLDDAINKFIDEYAMPNSKITESELIDYITDATGIQDVTLTTNQWRINSLASWQDVDQGSPTFKKEIEIEAFVKEWINAGFTYTAI